MGAVSYRAKCRARASKRRWVLHNRSRRAHERMFRALEKMRPPEPSGNTLADLMAAEMFGAGQQLYRSLHVYTYGPRWMTWEERYREARHGR